MGSIIGAYSGWRMTFVMVATLGVVALLGIRTLLPDVQSPPVVGFRDRVDILGRPAVVVALCLTTLGLMGGFVVFTYIGPLLARITGFEGRGCKRTPFPVRGRRFIRQQPRGLRR